MRGSTSRVGAAGGATLVAGALALNRALIDRETKPAEADAGGRILNLGAGDVHARETGPADGPATVLLHGFAGSLRWFDRLAPLLAVERRVVAVDLLGHGGSAKPAAGYAIEAQGDRVGATMDALGTGPALVVGHAMGGAVAVALAAARPGLVERLVILDEAPDNTFGSQPLLARLGFVPVIGELLHRVVTDGMVRDGYGDAFAPGFDLAAGFDDRDQVVRDFRRMTYGSYKRCWDEEERFLATTRLDERLRWLGVPALVIFGTEDAFFRAGESAEAFRAVPGTRVELIEGAGHSPAVERPEVVARLIGEFAGAGPA